MSDRKIPPGRPPRLGTTTQEFAVPAAVRAPATDPAPARASVARLVQLTGLQRGRVHQLHGYAALIGRDAEADLCIDAADVSREHARLWRGDDGTWSIDDLGSKNGVGLNGRPVRRAQLAFGDRLQFGAGTLFVFTYHDDVEEQIRQVQRFEAMGMLAGGVAHDFNNLLGALVSNIDFLDSQREVGELDAATLAECLGEMLEATGRAEQLIRQLLRVARSKAGAGQVDLSDLLEEVAGLCRHKLGPDIELALRVPAQAWVCGDAAQLHQVFMNLLVNARDAMPQGGRVEVLVAPRMLDKGASGGLAPGPYFSVVVRDTGHGMDAETRRRAFEPFFTTKAVSGTGLGLATVFALVRGHGGHIHVDSSQGQGTSVSVLLPAAGPQQAEKKRRKVTDGLTPVGLGLSRPGAKALMVDDDPAVLRTTARLLEQLGFDALTAQSGLEAVRIFEQHHEEIEFVLLDVVMPELDGAQTLALLRDIDPAVVVLLTSGHVDEQILEPLLATAASGFVAKPFGVNALRGAIAGLFH